jgi:hypothetical protein
MKTALVLMLTFVAASFAADPKPVKESDMRAQSGKPGEVKRLGSVTWDLEAHKLVWAVQTGSLVDGRFVLASEEKYVISPDKARMVFSGEERIFDGQEALSLHKLLDVLSLYCAESVVWWDQGQGAPATKQPSIGPEKPKVEGAEKPVKVGQPDDGKKPKYRVPAGHVIARARF